MAGNQNILREYLVALGFRIDTTGSKKVDGVLNKLDKKTKIVAGGFLGLAAAAAKMTHEFARSMEKMFYASRYADTTVSNLQAIEYGFRNIGMEGGRATSTLKGMSAAIRSNPGLIGLLNSLGIPVQGRDKAAVMLDLVGALKKMPFYIAERYASLFGIDPETLFNMQEGLDKLKQTADARKQMAEDMGVDADRAAKVAIEYGNLWRQVTERAGLFRDALAIELLPVVHELAGVTNEVMKDWVKVVQEIGRAGSSGFWTKMREGITGQAEGGGVRLSKEAKARLGLPEEELPSGDPGGTVGLYNRWLRWRDRKNGRGRQRLATDAAAVDAAQDMSDFQGRRTAADAGDTSPGGVDEPGFDPRAHLARLEKQYNLPAGLLDKVWKRESNRGDPKWMRSPAGAQGHFGFMPKTQKEYGLKDPDDFQESADASARKWRDLLKRYNGDIRKAAAAYNWGDGNLAEFGLSKAPKETRDYVEDIATVGGGSGIQTNTEIHIHGVSNPREAADRVVEQQRQVNADLVRNFSPKVR